MTTEIETYLNSLPEYISILDISSKSLKSLLDLTRFKKLKTLNCSNNQLTLLPTLPQKLKILNCFNNQLTSLPTLPHTLEALNCNNNPIYEIVYNNSLIKIKQNIQTLNNFRYLYSSLKMRNWLWEKVLKYIIEKKYHPSYLIENLGDDDDLDEVLNNWK